MARSTLERLGAEPAVPSRAKPPQPPVELDIDLDLLERLEEAQWQTRPVAYRRLA